MTEKTIVALFEAQVRATPEAIALIAGDAVMSYRDLSDRSKALAAELIAAGVRRGDRVGVFMKRSFETIAGELAILFAGAAYVPLDPAYPTERLRFVVADAGIDRVLIREDERARAEALGAKELWAVDLRPRAQAFEAVPVAPIDLAYVLYTSGSTGTPKGVMIEHRSVVRLVYAPTFVELGPAETLLQLTPESFDVSAFEIWGALLNGAKLALYVDDAADLPRVQRVLAEQKITVLWLTSGVFHRMVDHHLEAFAGLTQLIAGGEVLSPLHVQKFVRAYPKCRFVNGYGPTEGTIFATSHQVDDADTIDTTVPIGRPLPETATYIADAHLELLPPGSAGELLIAGLGVARGYLARPGLTAERFVPDPYSGVPGARLYRSGDRCRFRAGGVIEFLGRLDRQLKVRGFRIEPGEIEAALERHPEISSAAVDLAVLASGERGLVGWIVSDRELSATELRAFLEKLVPAHAIPSAFVKLDALPLTRSGKLDRARLPAPAIAAQKSTAADAPLAPEVEIVIGLFSQILNVREVGADHDFFALGGHSLLAVQLTSRVRDTFGMELPIRTLFDRPTPRGVAQAMKNTRPTRSPVAQRREGEALPAALSQNSMWILERSLPGLSLFHLQAIVRIEGRLDLDLFQLSWDHLLARHESLRTTFSDSEHGLHQHVRPELRVPLVSIDLSTASEDEKKQAIERRVRAEIWRPFHLDRGPLARLVVLREDERRHVVILTMHHIVTDGWSMSVLIRELAEAYAQLERGRPPSLPPLPLQYADFARWERDRLEAGELEVELAYWKKQLGDITTASRLPTDRPRLAPEESDFKTAIRTATIDRALTEAVRKLARAEGATVFMVLLAALYALLRERIQSRDLRVATLVANRTRTELETVIGVCTNALVLRSRLDGTPSFLDQLRHARDLSLDAYAHQELPFEALLEQLEETQPGIGGLLFEVMFVLQSAVDQNIELPGLHITPLDPAAFGAQTGLTPTTTDMLLIANEWNDELRMQVTYKHRLFDAETIDHFLADYLRILGQGVKAAFNTSSTTSG